MSLLQGHAGQEVPAGVLSDQPRRLQRADSGFGSSYCKRQPVAGLLELHLSQDAPGSERFYFLSE